MSLKFYNLIPNAFIKSEDTKRRSKKKKRWVLYFFSLWCPHGLFVKFSRVFTCRLFVYLLNSTLKRIKYLTFIFVLTFSFTFALTFSFTFAFVLLIVCYFSDYIVFINVTGEFPPELHHWKTSDNKVYQHFPQ